MKACILSLKQIILRNPMYDVRCTLYVLAVFCSLFLACTNFPFRYDNIVKDQKIRPFAMVCEPPEAAPGDTVLVRLYYYKPENQDPSIHWKISLDYGMDLYGQEKENRLADLDSMMLPGGRPDSFAFVVPDSALLYNTQLASLFNNPDYNPTGYSLRALDSLLKVFSAFGGLPPQAAFLMPYIDQVACRLKLRAQLRTGITLDVTKQLRVRYSRKFHSPNVNQNPRINWLGILAVPAANVYNFDSTRYYETSFYYLYYPLHPDSVQDTVVVDSGYSYFVVADSGIAAADTQRQLYSYMTQDGAVRSEREEYNYEWFYTNQDFQEGMVMDSLILITALGMDSYAQRLLPPVDTAMHRFTLYTVVRDFRWSDITSSTGADFQQATGYFRYTEAYSRYLRTRAQEVTISVGF